MLSSLDFDSCIVLTHYCWVFWFMCMYILVIMIIRFYWLYYDYEYDYDSHVSVEKLLLHYSFFPWTMSCPITSLLIFGINYFGFSDTCCYHAFLYLCKWAILMLGHGDVGLCCAAFVFGVFVFWFYACTYPSLSLEVFLAPMLWCEFWVDKPAYVYVSFYP